MSEEYVHLNIDNFKNLLAIEQQWEKRKDLHRQEVDEAKAKANSDLNYYRKEFFELFAYIHNSVLEDHKVKIDEYVFEFERQKGYKFEHSGGYFTICT